MLNMPEAIPIELEGLFKELEQRVMSDIVRRIKINGELTRSADWQIHRLHELGASKRVIKKHIKEALDLSSKEINHLYKDVVRQGYAHDKQLYKVKGKPFIPFEDNKALQQLIESVISQTNGELFNITQSLGFAQNVDGRLSFKPIAEYYQRTLDAAMLDITTGVFDYNTVLKRTVSEMTKSGLRTVDYASGWSNRVTVASRRAIMTGITQVTAKINEDNAQQLGTDYFEVSWHIGARPEHQVWQGKVYTREQLHTICGLGTGAGLCGWNCYHEYSPFVMGLSERTYTDEWLAEQSKRENTPTEYKGKEYTAYQASQRQRKLETQMRAERQKIKLLQEGGADEEDIITARARYRTTSAEYVRFSKTMGLPQQMERVRVDGLGSVGQGKWKTRINEARASELFNIVAPYKGDAIKPQSIFKELNKTDIGKETIEYIKASGIIPKINYTDECPAGLLGRQYDYHIDIFAKNTKTIKKTATIIIHEVTHSKYNIGGNQWAEAVCFAREKIHEKGGKPLTLTERKNIIKTVKKLYPNMKWRKK